MVEQDQIDNSTNQVRLVVIRGEQKGKSFIVEEGENLIGRWDPDQGAFPEIDLDELDVDAKVSRKHAVLHRSGSKLEIEDLGSLNGTFLNQGPRLEPSVKVPLKSGDELIVGKTFLKVEATS